MSEIKTIAVDIDDVLSANAAGFVRYCNQKWGTNLSVDDYTEHWGQMWQVDDHETELRSKHIHENISEVVGNYSHDESAKEVLKKLSKCYKLVIVTSRRRSVEKDTFEWLEKYFGGIFEEVHFAGIWDTAESLDNKVKATKADVLQQVGADYLIDDQPKHCIAAADAGIISLLFGDYKWNRDVELSNNMIRTKTWSDVLEYFNGRS